MRLEIMKVSPDRLDPECLLVTLRHSPGWWARLFGAREIVVTYKGHTESWYVPPSFRPAPTDIVKFLNRIADSHEFAHLRPQKRY
ncbi:hypothetical protein [Permianibacter aggregans]|uniref:Uncharacterized protein n=2 Tax=Permianibacter aggregans TaxID=1510150 RepID=A0A4R6UT74_9GAMM|nr:hypothetical protein [Permianibacter aggregans]TDQ50332.1 hypothetical protein EV696_10211 [Permianibacter aggregans]